MGTADALGTVLFDVRARRIFSSFIKIKRQDRRLGDWSRLCRFLARIFSASFFLHAVCAIAEVMAGAERRHMYVVD